LQYRSLRFEEEVDEKEFFQEVAVVNTIDYSIPYTRTIEHKHFLNDVSEKTIITREYPMVGDYRTEPYYTINNDKNEDLADKYKALAQCVPNLFFGGRLGSYKYLDMDRCIEETFQLVDSLGIN
jgi:UDP-galactopyranose mutase